jgi:hypothetical protein
MPLISNIRASILCAGLIAVGLIWSDTTCAAPPPPSVQTTKTDSAPAAPVKPGCPPLAGHPTEPIFQDLKGINLYVEIPSNYRDALACQQNRETCLIHAPGFGAPDVEKYKDVHDDYLQNLKRLYAAYPKPLVPDNLTTQFRMRIQNSWAPFIERVDGCTIPQVTVVTRTKAGPGSSSGLEPIRTPGSLTITVRVNIFDDTKPRIAVLSATRFRPDCGHMHHSDSKPVIEAIPLDQSDAAIAARIGSFVHRAVPPISIKEEFYP